MIPPYSHTLRQPFQIKVSSIKNFCNTIKKIFTVVFVLLVIFGACFVIAPMPIRRAVHKVYYHPSFVTNESSMLQLQKKIKPYTIPQKVLPDFSGQTTHSTSLGEEGYGDRIEKIRNLLDLRHADTLLEGIKKSNGGGIRDDVDVVLLLFDKPKITRPEMENLFYNAGGSCQDSESFHSMFDKLEKYENIATAIEYMSTVERNIIAKIIPYSCYPGQIPYKLKELSFQILELARKIKIKQINPVTAAAYIHQEIVRIQPFKQETDLTARIWMNILLQMGGYKAIAMPRDDYHYVMETDLRIPGYFSSQLETIIEWNRHQTK